MNISFSGKNVKGESKHFLHNSLTVDTERIATDKKTREFVNFSSDSLQKSYDQIQELKRKNESKRERIRQLEEQLQNLEYSKRNIRSRLTEQSDQSEFNNHRSSTNKPSYPKPSCSIPSSLPINCSNYNVFASKIDARKNHQDVKVDSSKARTSQDQNQSVDQNKKENLLVNCSKLKDMAVNSNRYLRKSLRKNLRHSFLRQHPSELQLSLRTQLGVMQKEKETTIENLKTIRTQKQNAINTLMGTIEVHSQTLQHLMQQNLEEKDSRTTILSPKFEKFRELNGDLHQLEKKITHKMANLDCLQITNDFLTVQK